MASNSDPNIETLNQALMNFEATDDDESEDRLIIGLDFGTTYSGVAYVFTTKPDQVYTITEWPGAKGRSLPKVPTLIRYSDNVNFQWGYELDRTTKDRIEGIKLLLDPDQSKPLYVPPVNAEAELQKLGKPAIDVATDYIRAIYQHALRKIEGKYPKSYLDMLNKQFVLSVPAVWSDKAKDATLQAARNAGIGPIKLIKEPEAAALFTLHFLKNKGLDVGDALVLCDAGGGTVDLISYEITSLNPLELKELVPCTGGLAGSLMLNLRFEQWVKDVVGEEAFLDLRGTDAFRLAMKQFDAIIKPGFRSRDDENQYVNFPMANLRDNPTRGLKANCITMTGRALHDIFEPLIKDIDKLVGEQVDKVCIKRMRERHPKGFDIKAIFLVGGFGSSAYLRECIANAHPDIQVIQPDDAWSAIVRGAVLSQLPQEASVTCNVAPKHYGVPAADAHDPIRDEGQERFLDENDEVWRSVIIIWYIHKGDDLLRSRKNVFPFSRPFPPNPSRSDLLVEEELFECSSDKAPVHPKAGVVTRNCTIKADLSSVPRNLFLRKSKPTTGEEYWELHYELLVSIESGPMVFSLMIGGKEYGGVLADY